MPPDRIRLAKNHPTLKMSLSALADISLNRGNVRLREAVRRHGIADRFGKVRRHEVNIAAALTPRAARFFI